MIFETFLAISMITSNFLDYILASKTLNQDYNSFYGLNVTTSRTCRFLELLVEVDFL